MFRTEMGLEGLNQMGRGNMLEHLDIVFTHLSSDCIKAKMPVDHRTKQPFGLLHGGASVVLAETLGSVAAGLALIDPSKQSAVGVEINANHLKSVRSGWVEGVCVPLRLGKRLHVYDIKLYHETQLVCVSRLTVAILNVEA